ncbi:thyroid receptor-interacting protein 11 isoform X2 [Nilaparvata lugens]|nr:thyroid receptor-interacting protein 11 isoform X2 [Nilaparvata lugens]
MAKIINEKHKLEHKCKILDQEKTSFAKELEEVKAAYNSIRHERGDSKSVSLNEKTEENENAKLQRQVQQLTDEIDSINAEKVHLRSELATMIRAVQDLESQVAVSQDENANLSTGMEELDMEHQQAIEQIMTLKNNAVRDLEQLRSQHAELKSMYAAELKLRSEPHATTHSCSQTDAEESATSHSCSQTDAEESATSHSCSQTDAEKSAVHAITHACSQTDAEESTVVQQTAADVHEAPVNGKLRNTGSDQSVIPDEYFADVAPSHPSETEEVRSLQLRLQESEEELEALEKQNMALIEKVQSLTATCERLAPIAEGSDSEQVEALEQKVSALDEQVQVLREVRTNLEVEMSTCRAEAQAVHAQLAALQASHKHQDNLHNEIAQLQQHNQFLTEQHQQQLTTLANNMDQQMEKEKLINIELSQQITCLKEQVETLRLNECDRSCSKCESKERKMCELILEKSVSDKELEQTKQELIDLKDIYTTLNDETASKRSQLEEIDRQKTDLEREISLRNKSYETLEDMHRKLQTQLSNYVEDHKKNLASIEEKTGEILELQNKFQKLQADHMQLVKKDRENDEYKSSAVNMEVVLKEVQAELNDSKQIINTIENDKSNLLAEINKLSIEKSEKDSELVALEQQIQQYKDLTSILEAKLAKINEDFVQKEGELGELRKNVQNSVAAEESVNTLKQLVDNLEKRNKQLEHRCGELELESSEKMPKLLLERDQLIGSLQAKHSESMEYHAEIQRLNKLISDELAKNALLTSDVSSLMETSTDLKQQMQGKEETLKHQHNEIMSLRVQVESLQSQLDYASQLLRVDDRQEAEGQPSSQVDSDLKKEYVTNSETDQSNLAGSLLQEQTRNKYLQNEVQEQHEKEASLIKEIERLREHLVNVEDSYTQEMVKAEEKVQELQQRLSQANEKVKNSSTAYTSVSIRANQQVEALQSQMKLMTEHQQQLEAQLSASEDKLQKQAAALTNLQIVLEQFQRDKQKDISLETARLQQCLDSANDTNLRLKKTTESLQAQLEEAKEGLRAASRLGEQLEMKQQIIVDLNTKLQQLQDKLVRTEEKLKTTTSGVEGKVDK